MTDEGRFSIELEHLQGYEFKVRFDWDAAPDVIMDEPPPLGNQQGPNASRMLAAAVGNCLSASLLYCLSKAEPMPGSVRTTASCQLVRNAGGRLRIGAIDVVLGVSAELVDSPRITRCLDLFEDFCVVTASVSKGIPVKVQVVDEKTGTVLKTS
jgi:organic hydroperoxide reductase OsmC/OhrA